jgi:hypothetical protein
MELARSLPCLQLSANGPYIETYESSPQLPSFQLKVEKVNLSLYMPRKHIGAVEVLLHLFLISELLECEWFILTPSRFTLTLRSILILPSNLLPVLPRGLLPSQYFLCICRFSKACYIRCPSHSSWYFTLIVLILDAQYIKYCNIPCYSILCSLLSHPPTWVLIFFSLPWQLQSIFLTARLKVEVHVHRRCPPSSRNFHHMDSSD